MRLMERLAVLASLLLASPALAAPPETLVDTPVGAGPFPTAVYVIGQGGDMRGEAASVISGALVARGFAVVRFNWRKPIAAPAPTLEDQAADLDAVLTIATQDRRLRGGSVIVVGKSLGSLVTAELMPDRPAIKGAVLLTPVCSFKTDPTRPQWLSQPYGRLATETRPIVFVAGEADPLCPARSLYALAHEMRTTPRVVVVAGDHAFQNPKHPSHDAANLRLVAEITAAAAVDMAGLPYR